MCDPQEVKREVQSYHDKTIGTGNSFEASKVQQVDQQTRCEREKSTDIGSIERIVDAF
jgi:hypothetical protein